jgi:hypothetical protein
MINIKVERVSDIQEEKPVPVLVPWKEIKAEFEVSCVCPTEMQNFLLSFS